MIYHNDTKFITNEEIRKAARTNSDGCGFMFAEKGKLVIRKFMDVEKFIKAYQADVDRVKTSFVLHFRLGTGGKVNIPNAHPFKITNNVAFAHNGILSDYKSTEELSDTAVFNEKVLKPIGDNVFNKSVRKMLESMLGSSKMIFLNNKGEHFILNKYLGDDTEAGIWRSYKQYNNYNRSYNTNNTAYVFHRCERCNKSLSDERLYTLKGPNYGFARYICEDCITVDTKISDLLYVKNKSFNNTHETVAK